MEKRLLILEDYNPTSDNNPLLKALQLAADELARIKELHSTVGEFAQFADLPDPDPLPRKPELEEKLRAAIIAYQTQGRGPSDA